MCVSVRGGGGGGGVDVIVIDVERVLHVFVCPLAALITAEFTAYFWRRDRVRFVLLWLFGAFAARMEKRVCHMAFFRTSTVQSVGVGGGLRSSITSVGVGVIESLGLVPKFCQGITADGTQWLKPAMPRECILWSGGGIPPRLRCCMLMNSLSLAWRKGC